jgi:hypothetical protein
MKAGSIAFNGLHGVVTAPVRTKFLDSQPCLTFTEKKTKVSAEVLRNCRCRHIDVIYDRKLSSTIVVWPVVAFLCLIL